MVTVERDMVYCKKYLVYTSNEQLALCKLPYALKFLVDETWFILTHQYKQQSLLYLMLAIYHLMKF